MSKGAASEEVLGSIHDLTAKKIKMFLESNDPELVEKGLKLAVTFLDKNKIVCVNNDVEAIGDLDKVLQKKRKRFGSEEPTGISDFAAERAKRVINE